MLPKELEEIIDVVLVHNNWRRRETINLIASENVMSPLAELVYLNDMAGRYAEGTVGNRYYQGTKYVDLIEDVLTKRFAKALGATYVDVRPVSGTVANLATYFALFPEGGVVASLPVKYGGHISHNTVGGLKALRLKMVELPWDLDRFNIDVDRARKVIEETKPNLVILGGSLYLFPHPIREIAEIAKASGAYVLHDSAHVFGLIIGGVFPNPLKEGAHVITTSTHKTFPGPQGGLIAAVVEDKVNDLQRAVFPVFTSNYHLHRYAATYVTLVEMEHFGAEYARRVVENARALAEALAEQGVPPVAEALGYTRTHQVAVDVSKFGGGDKVAAKLEEANIIVNKNALPWDKSVLKPSGIRLGVQEMTRFGMGKDEMREIAKFIARVLSGEDPAGVRRDVAEFRKAYLEIKYGFKIDRELVDKVFKSLGLYT
ncbi:Glycine/serine hydroxymethyltransferase [Pyrobaculum oguniense TE7]|uniref:Serine hydroxymethyltransferase n=1 Tax=Pyrobaculum oguniense (strain DSM 13380 / JCM 10595 / TE7) TaxID=698757 RepID=H6QDC4_PYROT|nr:Glycine/serine hydroxymethyltransferase [Pyrobaculum oguniense TE7]